MKEHYYQWFSPNLNRAFNMLAFGHAGQPLMLFPTSMGRYYENKDRGMIDSVGEWINGGRLMVYCPDSIDRDSWYNHTVHPSVRAENHNGYDALLFHEILPRAQQESGFERIMVAGCSFGGYHAANFAFRYPAAVSHLVSMSGIFDIRFRLDGYYDDNVYFNNPVDYLPGNHDAAAADDVSRRDNEILSGLLNEKQISHWLDIRENAVHDWPIWKHMFRDYVSIILHNAR